MDFFFGYFDPEFFLKIMEINHFRGDLTDISAKKEALLGIAVLMCWLQHTDWCGCVQMNVKQISAFLFCECYYVACIP